MRLFAQKFLFSSRLICTNVNALCSINNLFIVFFLNIMKELLISKLIRPIRDTTCVRLIRNLIMIIIKFII